MVLKQKEYRISLKSQAVILLGFPGGSVVENCLPIQETQEAQVQCLGWGNPLEKAVAAHSSVPAREIPWTEGPGGPQSVGSHGVSIKCCQSETSQCLRLYPTCKPTKVAWILAEDLRLLGQRQRTLL